MNNLPPCNSHKTAIKRKEISAPLKFLITNGLVPVANASQKVLDFGCGKGIDAKFLGCDGYDPYWGPIYELPTKKYDYVLVTYVINTLTTRHHNELIWDIASVMHAKSIAYISTRTDIKKPGWTKSWKTYQQTYDLSNQPYNLKQLEKNDKFAIYEYILPR